MNKKLIFSLCLGWIIAFAAIYCARDLLAVSAFAGNGIPDVAFRWALGVERVLVSTVLIFSILVFFGTSAIFLVAKKL